MLTPRRLALVVVGSLALSLNATAASFQGIQYFNLTTSVSVLSADGSTVGGSAFNDSSAGRWQPATGFEMFASSVFYTATVTGISSNGSVAVGNYGWEPDGSIAFSGASVGFSGSTAAVPCGAVSTATFEALSLDGTVALRRHTCRNSAGSFPPVPTTHALSLAGASPVILGVQPGFAASGAVGQVRLDAAGGVVAGYSSDASAQSAQPFRWTPVGGFQSPPVALEGDLNSSYPHILALSADGSAIAGSHFDGATNEAYVWRPGGVTFLGDLSDGAFDSRAMALSADGSVAAGTATSAAGTEAFVWTDVTGLFGIGELPGGAFSSFANLVSYDGSRVFGSSESAEGGEAIVWDAANGMRRVEDLLIGLGVGPALAGWRLEVVTAISQDGLTIAGNGYDANGRQRGWIATIPEPGSGLLAAVGAALLLLQRSRSQS